MVRGLPDFDFKGFLEDLRQGRRFGELRNFGAGLRLTTIEVAELLDYIESDRNNPYLQCARAICYDVGLGLPGDMPNFAEAKKGFEKLTKVPEIANGMNITQRCLIFRQLDDLIENEGVLKSGTIGAFLITGRYKEALEKYKELFSTQEQYIKDEQTLELAFKAYREYKKSPPIPYALYRLGTLYIDDFNNPSLGDDMLRGSAALGCADSYYRIISRLGDDGQSYKTILMQKGDHQKIGRVQQLIAEEYLKKWQEELEREGLTETARDNLNQAIAYINTSIERENSASFFLLYKLLSNPKFPAREYINIRNTDAQIKDALVKEELDFLKFKTLLCGTVSLYDDCTQELNRMMKTMHVSTLRNLVIRTIREMHTDLREEEVEQYLEETIFAKVSREKAMQIYQEGARRSPIILGEFILNSREIIKDPDKNIRQSMFVDLFELAQSERSGNSYLKRCFESFMECFTAKEVCNLLATRMHKICPDISISVAEEYVNSRLLKKERVGRAEPTFIDQTARYNVEILNDIIICGIENLQTRLSPPSVSSYSAASSYSSTGSYLQDSPPSSPTTAKTSASMPLRSLALALDKPRACQVETASAERCQVTRGVAQA